MKESDIIFEFHKLLLNKHQEINLKTISGEKFNNEDAYFYYVDACGNKSGDGKKVLDMYICSNNIASCLAHIALYQNYVSFEPFRMKTMCDKIYCRYVAFALQEYYNFWDRIGDLLNFHYGLMSVPAEDFNRVIEALEKKGINSTNFIWLNDYKKSEYKKLNDYRKNIVHYYTIQSQYLNKNTNFWDNAALIQVAEEFRETVKSLFENNEKTILGFQYTVELIRENS